MPDTREDNQLSALIKKRIEIIRKDIISIRHDNEVEIVCVSKNRNIDIMKAALEAGINHFGENKAQEVRDKSDFFTDKRALLSFIGRIQKNKIKYLVNRCSMIQSVDSFETAEAVDSVFEKAERKIKILMQLNSSYENQKAGVYPEDAVQLWEKISKLNSVELCGIMTIGAHLNDTQVIEKSFIAAFEIFSEIRKNHVDCRILSMGMSDDYKIALKYNSNMLRLGRAVFED